MTDHPGSCRSSGFINQPLRNLLGPSPVVSVSWPSWTETVPLLDVGDSRSCLSLIKLNLQEAFLKQDIDAAPSLPSPHITFCPLHSSFPPPLSLFLLPVSQIYHTFLCTAAFSAQPNVPFLHPGSGLTAVTGDELMTMLIEDKMLE